MKRLLCIIGTLNAGGAETFMIKLYRKLDLDRYQMDFVVTGDASDKGFYYDEITERGGRIYYLPPRMKSPRDAFSGLKNIVKDGGYDSVLKLCSSPSAVFDLFAAKAGGAKRIAVRACNAEVGASKLKSGIFHLIMSALADVKIAPSDLAAEYVFGKGAVRKNKVFYLRNALDLDKYKFDEAARKRIRQELGAENAAVYGHIGRFNNQKNHGFLIEIFRCIKEKEQNSILILLGEGELTEKTKEKVREYNLQDSVRFLGIKKNVPEYLSAMDTFVLPSFYEGMPNVIIEAQATGLPCIISDTVTREAAVTDGVKFESLKEPPQKWAEAAIDMKNNERSSNTEKLRKSGYDIDMAVLQFQDLVFC